MARPRNRKLIGGAFYMRLLRSIKRSIREVQGPEDKEIKSYYRAYAAFLEKAKAADTLPEYVVDSALGTGVLLVGDFHTLWQAQRQFIKVLDLLVERCVKPVVLLEMAPVNHNRLLGKFLSGEIDEREYLDRAEYFESWGFDFTNYGKVLRYLKEKEMEAFGINGEGSLRKRDRSMAAEIAKARERSGGSPVVVMVGDLHIAPGHLPKELAKLGIRSTLLFQNSETVILRRSRGGSEPYGWFHLGGDAFLVNNTPPWVKMQSYLTWLEHGSEALHSMYGFTPAEEDDEESEGVDFSGTVQNYIRALKDVFNLHNKADDDFQVYTMEDLTFLDDPFFRREPGKTYARVIKNARSLFMTRGNTIYTVGHDVNHTVEESMHYLMAKDMPCGGGEERFWERIHYFASGYVASKMINPMRHAMQSGSLREILEKIETAASSKDRKYLETQAAVCRNMHRFFELLISGDLTSLELSTLLAQDEGNVFELSRAIGYQLGEAIYHDYNAGKLSGRDIKHYMFSMEKPYHSCDEVLRKLKKINFICNYQ